MGIGEIVQVVLWVALAGYNVWRGKGVAAIVALVVALLYVLGPLEVVPMYVGVAAALAYAFGIVTGRL